MFKFKLKEWNGLKAKSTIILNLTVFVVATAKVSKSNIFLML